MNFSSLFHRSPTQSPKSVIIRKNFTLYHYTTLKRNMSQKNLFIILCVAVVLKHICVKTF